MNNLPAQSIAWNPNLFIGYSEKEIALIKVGFDKALNDAFEAEKKQQRKLLAALKELYARSGDISPLAGKTGVKGVRQAGKLIAARDKAAAAIAETGGKA